MNCTNYKPVIRVIIILALCLCVASMIVCFGYTWGYTVRLSYKYEDAEARPTITNVRRHMADKQVSREIYAQRNKTTSAPQPQLPIPELTENTTYPITIHRPYLIENAALCSSVRNLSVLVIVHTAPTHFDRRDVMRRTWTNKDHFRELGDIRVLFLLGRTQDEPTQIRIEKEFANHSDILQGDFIDAFHNLTLKGVMAYKWITERCRNAKVILKVDDDVIIDMYRFLIQYLPKLAGKTKQILCNHILPGTMPIIRDVKSKWFVNDTVFPGQRFYPRYCSGFCVIITNDIIPAIFKSAAITPFFWVDGVYLYGLLPAKVEGVGYSDFEKGTATVDQNVALSCYRNASQTCNYVVTGAGSPAVAEELWKHMTARYVASRRGQIQQEIDAQRNKATSAPQPQLPITELTENTTYIYPITIHRPYLIENAALCISVRNLSVLVIVHTAPTHFDRRDVMRRTWTNNDQFRELGDVRVLFLLGRTQDEPTQILIEKEFANHSDILQGDFIDAYHNLTLKGVMAYKWITERCRNAKVILKVDDDVIIDMYRFLLQYLPKLAGKTKQILCNHILPGTMPILRDVKSKWFVNDTLFPGLKHYPRYCSGFCVIITNDVIPAIYKSAAYTPFFWVDDVYLYGLLPAKVEGVGYSDFEKGTVSLSQSVALSCYRNTSQTCNYVVTGAGSPAVVEELWKHMTARYVASRRGQIQHTTDNTTAITNGGSAKTRDNVNINHSMSHNVNETQKLVPVVISGA